MLPTEQQSASTRIKWNKVTWYSGALAVLLFVALVCGAFFFGLWYQKQAMPINSATQQASESTYKMRFYGEIPSTWSTYFNLNNASTPTSTPVKTLEDLDSPSTIIYSFGPNGVFLNSNDMANQVDFYLITQAAAQALIDAANERKASIIKENVGGYESTVIDYSTENARSVKYFIMAYPDGGFYKPNFLLMREWPATDQDFENGFQHYLQTVSFQTEG